jgi:hypothetical protein
VRTLVGRLWDHPWARLFVIAWALLLLVGFFLPEQTWRPIHDWHYYRGPLVNWWYFVLPPAFAIAVRAAARGFAKSAEDGSAQARPDASPQNRIRIPPPIQPGRS